MKSSIETDVKTLNLTKYLTEIAAGLTEARYKIENISDAASICSMIHQRYSEFSGLLLQNFKKNLPVKKSEMVRVTVMTSDSQDEKFVV